MRFIELMNILIAGLLMFFQTACVFSTANVRSNEFNLPVVVGKLGAGRAGANWQWTNRLSLQIEFSKTEYDFGVNSWSQGDLGALLALSWYIAPSHNHRI